MRRLAAAFFVLLIPSFAQAQANGNLQIHFMDVGQGDGAILISPKGETVLFDNGVWGHCEKPLSYLQQLGITGIDYQVISHYHLDHFGCTSPVLTSFPLQKTSFDRGSSYHGDAYDAYIATTGNKRQTAQQGQVLTLDAGSTDPVTITFAALNGNGVQTDNENDLSLVALVRFGTFEAEIGGDLSGFAENNYEDIETDVAPKIGQVEVYKVHHHGSRYSSNGGWLTTIKPRIGIISAGATNRYGHPTEECIERLHHEGVKTYWTSEGNGFAAEPGMDVVAGNIIVEVVPGASTFSVRSTLGPTTTDTYAMWGSAQPPTPTPPAYSWSKHSQVYHYSTCQYVGNINPENLQTGATPPSGKTLHQGCPH